MVSKGLSVACNEFLAEAVISSWHSPQAVSGSLRDGFGIKPSCAAVFLDASALPSWQVSQAISPCSVSRKSFATSTLFCGSNGVTLPPHPAPEVRLDFFALVLVRFFTREDSLVWQVIQVEASAGIASAQRTIINNENTTTVAFPK